MTVLTTAVVVLVLNLVSGQPVESADGDPPLARAAPEAAARSSHDIRLRWKLRLLPEECPQIDPALLENGWSERSPHDILGRGTDRFIRFRAPREPQGGRAIVFTTVRNYGVNARVRETTTTATHPVTVVGPFLEYDGLLHTAFASRDVLVPDAIIQVAERQWYTVVAQRTMPVADGEPEVTLTEYLFEFDNDPTQAERGTLTLQRHVRKTNEAAGEVARFSSRFVRVRHAHDEREPYELQIGTPEQRSLKAWFYADRPYALLRDQPTIWTGIYRPDKGTP